MASRNTTTFILNKASRSTTIRGLNKSISEDEGHYEEGEVNNHDNDEKQQEDLNEPIMLVHQSATTLSSSLNYLIDDDDNGPTAELEYYEEEGGGGDHLPTITDIIEQQEGEGIEGGVKRSGLLGYWDSFTHSQFYVHMLMFSTLMTFGGFCVLAPNPIRTMRPTIFAFVRSLLMVICYFFLSLIFDRDFSFRSDRFLSRIKNPILRYLYKKTPSFRDFKRMVLCGSMYMLNMVLFVIGMKMINAAIASIVQPLVAVEVCLISIFLGREPSSIVKIVGVCISAIGAMAMLIIPSLLKEKAQTNEESSIWEAFSFVIGMIILIANTVAYAFYLILLKKLLNKKIPGITLNFWTFLGGLYIPFLAALYNISDFEIRRLDEMSYIGMAYAVLIHGTFSFILSSKASSLTSPTVIGIYATVSPVVTTAMTVLISHEEVSLWIIPGSVGIFVGVTMVILAKWREGKAKPITEKKESIMELEEVNVDNQEGDLPKDENKDEK